MKEIMQKLAVGIGPRPTGSKANEQALAYAEDAFRALGLRVERQRFDCLQWDEGLAELTLDGRALPCTPAPYALGCEADGPLVCVDSVEALRRADLRGKVALLRGALCAEGYMPKHSPFWLPDEHKEIIALLENSGVQAVLTAGLPDGDGPAFDDGDLAFSCAVVSRADAEALRDGQHAQLTMRLERQKAASANLIATLGEGEGRVCLCAHLDTKASTPGALDDASGVAVLLELARTLRTQLLPFAVEFVLINSEDCYSNAGDLLYMNERIGGDIRWAANVDSVGMQGCATAFSLYGCPDDLARCARELARQEGLLEMEPWPQGDQTLFAMKGVPALALTSEQVFTAPLHTAADTEYDPARLEDSARFLRKLIMQAAAR